MVALSVSTSANKSPLRTGSPTCLCQEAITPSVIVSLNRGIKITSAMGRKNLPEIKTKRGNAGETVESEIQVHPQLLTQGMHQGIIGDHCLVLIATAQGHGLVGYRIWIGLHHDHLELQVGNAQFGD